MSHYVSKSCASFFRNKDLIRYMLENLNLIEIRSVARTSKNFLEAAEKAKYVHGLIFDAGPTPQVFLEDELEFGNLQLDTSICNGIVPPPGSKIKFLITAILVTTIPNFPDGMTMEELESGALIELVQRIHPMLGQYDFPKVTDIYLNFRNVNLVTVQGWEGLSRHTERAKYVAMREYVDPAIWDHLNFKKVRVFDVDQPMWFGKFALPESADVLPSLQAVLVEICDMGAPQEVDLSRLNSFPSLVSLDFTFVNESNEFPTTLTLPPSLTYVRYLRVGDIEDEFSNDCKEKIQHLVNACPNLQVFSSKEDFLLEIKLLRGCDRKTEEEFADIMATLTGYN